MIGDDDPLPPQKPFDPVLEAILPRHEELLLIAAAIAAGKLRRIAIGITTERRRSHGRPTKVGQYAHRDTGVEL